MIRNLLNEKYPERVRDHMKLLELFSWYQDEYAKGRGMNADTTEKQLFRFCIQCGKLAGKKDLEITFFTETILAKTFERLLEKELIKSKDQFEHVLKMSIRPRSENTAEQKTIEVIFNEIESVLKDPVTEKFLLTA